MQSVSSNAVAVALQGLIKTTYESFVVTENGYITSTGGLLYKNIATIPNIIGAGHTLIGYYVSTFSQVNNHFFNVVTDSGARYLLLVTDTQSFKGNLNITFVYI